MSRFGSLLTRPRSVGRHRFDSNPVVVDYFFIFPMKVQFVFKTIDTINIYDIAWQFFPGRVMDLKLILGELN